MKWDNPITESAAVKVSYILLRLSTPSRHNRASLDHRSEATSTSLLVNCLRRFVSILTSLSGLYDNGYICDRPLNTIGLLSQ